MVRLILSVIIILVIFFSVQARSLTANETEELGVKYGRFLANIEICGSIEDGISAEMLEAAKNKMLFGGFDIPELVSIMKPELLEVWSRSVAAGRAEQQRMHIHGLVTQETCDTIVQHIIRSPEGRLIVR